jgi:hypothetical protein
MKNDSPQAQSKSVIKRLAAQQKCPACGELNCFDHALRTMTTEPQAQPPERIWISAASLPRSRKDGVGSFYPNFSGDASRFDLIEYIRADLPRAAADDDLVAALTAVVIDESLPRPDGPCWCDDEYDSKGPHTERCQRIKELTRRASTPRAQTGLTVEAALKELRELFPDVEQAYYDFLTQQIVLHLPGEWIKYFGGNLDEAMQKVRAWAKSRAEREGERSAG